MYHVVLWNYRLQIGDSVKRDRQMDLGLGFTHLLYETVLHYIINYDQRVEPVVCHILLGLSSIMCFWYTVCWSIRLKCSQTRMIV